MKKHEHVVYSINVEDIQTVAVEEYGRVLSEAEVEVIEDNLGDYIKWYDLIDIAISIHLGISKVTNDNI